VVEGLEFMEIKPDFYLNEINLSGYAKLGFHQRRDLQMMFF
jgi:hypothetical protein